MEIPRVSLDDVAFVGEDLHRPECVVCARDGAIYVPDWRGGITRISPDGNEQPVHGGVPDDRLKPNSLAMRRDGSFLIANLADEGGVWSLQPGRVAEPFLRSVDGTNLPPCNFVLVDVLDRVWITVSTRMTPRALGYRPDIADGFVVMLDSGGARIVADGLGYTNEVRFDPGGNRLYVVETFGRRISRFCVASDGSLSDKEVFTTFGPGTFPDGMAFDADDHLWVTSIVSNRLFRIAPDGSQTIVLEDSDPDHVESVETAFQNGLMVRSHMDTICSRKLRSISSIAFGGPDLRTIYLGCILGNSLASFRSPVPGTPMAHWRW